MRTIEKLPEQGFRDFDLPREHLIDERHFVPAKSHDPSEIARRRELTRGTLIAETQKIGVQSAERILRMITDEDGQRFCAKMLSAAGLNSSWYSYAQNASEMRRRLKLPILLHPRTRAASTLIEDAISAYRKLISRAEGVVEAVDYCLPTLEYRQRRLGVGVGNVSLKLSVYPLVQSGLLRDIGEDDQELQRLARNEALVALHDARTLHRDIGSHPSLAQLADPYSHLAVYWYRKAPGSAQKAVVDALVSENV